MNKLSDDKFTIYLAQVRRKVQGLLTSEKDINYGHQFVVVQGAKKCTLNIYNGKKGLNHVYAGDSGLGAQVAALLAAESGKSRTASVKNTADKSMTTLSKTACDKVSTTPVASKNVSEAMPSAPSGDNFAAPNVRDSAPRLWAGSDESGKGDFFGSLVVAAVVVDDSTAAKLAAAGVKDCKLLSDKKILQLEEVIKANVVDFSVLELKPKAYNLRYEQVAAQGGKLNQLLGNGHITALTQVLNRQPQCESALIDQFTTSTILVRTLHVRFPHCSVHQQPKAESDLAVAAASVLARARFLRTMTELAQQAGEAELPKGGSALATTAARRIAQVQGKAALRDYVKLHFANYQRI